MIPVDTTTSYADALAAATEPTAWNVLQNESATVSGLPATRIEATSTAGSPGFPAGVRAMATSSTWRHALSLDPHLRDGR